MLDFTHLSSKIFVSLYGAWISSEKEYLKISITSRNYNENEDIGFQEY